MTAKTSYVTPNGKEIHLSGSKAHVHSMINNGAALFLSIKSDDFGIECSFHMTANQAIRLADEMIRAAQDAIIDQSDLDAAA